MEELQQLLAAMGCASPSEALAQVARTQTALASLQAATGRASVSEAIASSSDAVCFAKSVEQELGCSGPHALGKIAGLKAAQLRVVELEASVAAGQKATADRDASASIDQATADTRLTPADRHKAEGIYAKYGTEGLNDYLALLPKGAAGRPSAGNRDLSQPAPTKNTDPGVRASLLAKGFSEAELDAAEKLPTRRVSGEED